MLNFVSDFPIKSAFWPKIFSSPAAGLKGLRLACGGFATLASTIIPVGSGDGVTSQGCAHERRLLAAHVAARITACITTRANCGSGATVRMVTARSRASAVRMGRVTKL